MHCNGFLLMKVILIDAKWMAIGCWIKWFALGCWHRSFFLIHCMSWTHWVSDSDYIGMALSSKSLNSMLSITLDNIIFPHRRSNVYLRQTGYGSPCCWEMRVDDVWDDCVTSLSVSCHEIGVGRRKELYLAHILGHYLFVVVNAWCNSSSRSKWMYYI